MAIKAVLFDLDGTLISTEHAWEAARREVSLDNGGRWLDDAQATMMGMSTPEWTSWMKETLGVQLPVEEIYRLVTEKLDSVYRQEIPVIDGAPEAVEQIADRWDTAIASSSSRHLIDLVVELTSFGPRFKTTVSSEEVERGKPHPDVFLEAARRLGAAPEESVVIEDSTNGIKAGVAAGMHVVAIPEPNFPPDKEALDGATVQLTSIRELDPAVIESLG